MEIKVLTIAPNWDNEDILEILLGAEIDGEIVGTLKAYSAPADSACR